MCQESVNESVLSLRAVCEKFWGCMGRDRVESTRFAVAVDAFIGVLDVLGGVGFIELVKGDMKCNMEKIDRSCRRWGVHTLEEMVMEELRHGQHDEAGSGTEALLWLKRTLQFIVRLFYYLSNLDDSSLSDCAAKAYEETVRPCHNFILQAMFHAAIASLPSRESFMQDLGGASSALTSIQQLRDSIEWVLGSIVKFYSLNSLENASTCLSMASS
eukprot:CAMPEP_0184681508 /NCGR_PEP_ID=MMETSP0312-20130426/4498_1 /TAXON_ID=31354 /ORGANISM="Compsopogon coeruleus, Strain SAG 36.94" /LENGTH=214 /DNA_ID=CAMNT_0027132409 /DNA_START=98 /DNA_END=742 /DNA_ORIENTATION=+